MTAVLPQRAASLSLPALAFEPNAGRVHDESDFFARLNGVVVALGRDRTRFSLPGGETLTTKLVGARPGGIGVAEGRRSERVNWFVGSDPKGWRRGLPTYARVRYRDVYSGIDVVYHGRAGALEYDFVVAPRADPKQIVLGLHGAGSLHIARNGDLVARAGTQTLRQLRPIAYQRIGTKRRPVSARFVVDGPRARIRLGVYDSSKPLVIDPVLAYSDYIAGGGTADVHDVAVDSSGNAYVAGGSGTGTILKLNRDGSRAWTTHLGQSVFGVAVGPSGDIYVTGQTGDGLAATAGAAQHDFAGVVDGFVGRLGGASGTPAWLTYIGGTQSDGGTAITVDGSGNAYVAGSTFSAGGIATTGAYDTSLNGGFDVFVEKYDASGTRQFGTYLGGGTTTDDIPYGVGVAPGCASDCPVYVAGSTLSNNFPVTNGSTLEGTEDPFASKLNANGTDLVWSTYFGSVFPGNDRAVGLAMTPAGDPTLIGPVHGATKSFFATLTAGATAGSVTINGGLWVTGVLLNDVAYDSQGNMYATGRADDIGPFDPPTVQATIGGLHDAYVWKRPSGPGHGSGWQTYLGGSKDDAGFGIAPDATGSVWVVGTTSSTNFPTAPAPGSSPSGQFIARIQVAPATINSGPQGPVRSRTATFTYSTTEYQGTFQCRLTPVEADFSSCPTAGKTYSGLANGEYKFEVKSVDPAGTAGEPAARAFSVDGLPIAQLSIAPNPVLVARPVTFDASGSSAGDQPIVRYEWDLDGDGSFELDTGATATASNTYATPQTTPVHLRLTDAAGATATADGTLQVTATAPPTGLFGVTINNGAQFTRTPDVTVTANFPAGTTGIILSNDGGFLAPSVFPAQKTTSWKLDSSGPERLPKTIYARFQTGPLVSETHQDDIILDEIPPTVQNAAVAPAAAAASGAAAAARAKRWLVKVKATDSNSGVSKLQVTANKRKPGRVLAYKRKFTVKSAKRPRWVRARDRAGNWSKWRKAR